MKSKFVCLILIVVLLSNLVILSTMASGGVSAGGGAGVGIAKPSLSNGMPAKFEFVRCAHNDGKVTAQINFTYLQQAGMLYLAIYNDNQLIALQNKPVAVNEPMNTIEIFNVDKNCENYLIKAFYWDGDTLLTPLANLIEGKIESVSYSQYGFILGAGAEMAVGDVTYMLRLLNDEGDIITYNLADKLRFADATANGVVASNVPAATVYMHVDSLKNIYSWVHTENIPENIDNYARRIITYRTNSNGDISEIIFAGTRYDGKESYLTYNGISDVKQSVTYNANTQSFVGAYAVEEDTIVFNLPIEPGATRDDFAIDTIDSFAHKEEYDVVFLSIDENYVSKVMIVVNNKKQKPVEPEEPAEPEPDLTPANYGFILGAGSESFVGDVTYQVRLLDKDGNIATYNLAEKLRFADATADGRVVTGVNALIVYDYISALNVFGSWVKTTDWDTATDAQKLADLAEYADRIVTYKTNSNGDISEIIFAGTRYDGTETYLTNNGAAGNFQYNANTQSFINGYAVTEDTVVFNLPIEPGATRDDFAIDTIDSFAHKGVYDVAFLSIDENYVSKVMIVVNNKKQKPVEPEEPSEPEPDLTPANYGFILGAGVENVAGDVTYMLRLLNDEGDIITYNLASKLRFADSAADGVVVTGVNALIVYDYISALNVFGSWVKTTDWDTATDAQKLADLAEYADRIVTYKTNSNGDISEIIFAGTRYDGKESYLTNNGAAGNFQYNADTKSFVDACSVDEDTIVFNLPINSGATRDDFKMETIDFFLHEAEYDVAFLSVSADNVAKIVIVTSNIKIGSTSKLAVATLSLVAENANKEEIYYITYFQNGKLQTRSTTAKLYQELDWAPSSDDIFECSVNKYGSIDAIALGDAYGNMWNGSIDVVSDYPSYYDLDGDKVQYVFGVVKSKTNNGIIAIGNNWDRHVVSDNTNFYLVDCRRFKDKVSISSYDEIQASEAEIDPDTNSIIWNSDYAVFMKYYNEEITDVIIYKGALTQGLIN